MMNLIRRKKSRVIKVRNIKIISSEISQFVVTWLWWYLSHLPPIYSHSGRPTFTWVWLAPHSRWLQQHTDSIWASATWCSQYELMARWTEQEIATITIICAVLTLIIVITFRLLCNCCQLDIYNIVERFHSSIQTADNNIRAVHNVIQRHKDFSTTSKSDCGTQTEPQPRQVHFKEGNITQPLHSTQGSVRFSSLRDLPAWESDSPPPPFYSSVQHSDSASAPQEDDRLIEPGPSEIRVLPEDLKPQISDLQAGQEAIAETLAKLQAKVKRLKKN